MDQIQKMSIMKRDIPVTIGLNDSSAHWRYWNRIVDRNALILQVARSHLVCWFPRHVDTFILNSFGIFLRLCFLLSPRFLLTPLHIHGGMAGGCCGWLMLTMHGFVTVKSENISYIRSRVCDATIISSCPPFIMSVYHLGNLQTFWQNPYFSDFCLHTFT